jgi:predicted RNase H-like HicB family nuclease
MTEQAEYQPYSMDIAWDPRGAIFVVTAPELDGCRTHGGTYAEAARQGREAIETWIEAERILALPIPEPRVFDHDVADRWWSHVAESRASVRPDDDALYPPYSMVLEWDPRSDIFVVTIPEFRGARTHGRTYEDAVDMGREVIESFVDLAREDGASLPPIRIFAPRRVEAVA